MVPPDWHLSVWITDFAGTHHFLDALMKVVASNYFAPRLTAVVVICLWFGTRDSVRRSYNQKAIVAIAFGALIGFAVAEAICLLQDHIGDFWSRPYDSHPEAQAAMDLLYFRLPDSSFPSNAMCGLVPIAAGLWYADRRASLIVWAMVSIWALGRVYVGIHYPMDILGGVAIGLAGIYFGRRLVRMLDTQVSWTLGMVRRLYLA